MLFDPGASEVTTKAEKIDSTITHIEQKLKVIDETLRFMIWSRKQSLKRTQKLKDRFIKRRMEKSWIAGFGLALAEVNRVWDMPTNIKEVIRNAGLKLSDFKASGLDPYDWEELAKCLAD